MDLWWLRGTRKSAHERGNADDQRTSPLDIGVLHLRCRRRVRRGLDTEGVAAVTGYKSEKTEANPNHHTWDAVNRQCLICGIAMMDSELDADCPEQGGVQIPQHPTQTTTQPGETQTYKARLAGVRILLAIDGLTPWAQRQVLEWALTQIRETVNDAPF